MPLGQDTALRQSGGSQVLPKGQVDSGALRWHHRDSSACGWGPHTCPLLGPSKGPSAWRFPPKHKVWARNHPLQGLAPILSAHLKLQKWTIVQVVVDAQRCLCF